jgi:MFS family permease
MTESATSGGRSGELPRGTAATAPGCTAPARAEQPGDTVRRGRFGAVFAVVTAGVAVVNLDMFIVNVALPAVARSFGGTDLASLSWVLNGYAIVFAALLVPAGRAADLIGRRAAFLAGMVLFGAASAGCAAAPGVWVLVTARIVQAAGGALLMPASLGLLLAVAPQGRRVAMIRAWTSVGGLAAALGPVLGGALVAASWHWVFLVNVPIVAAAVTAGLRCLPADTPVRFARRPPPAQTGTAQVGTAQAGTAQAGTGTVRAGSGGTAQAEAQALPDAAGALLFSIAIGLLALAIVKADDWGWRSPALLGSLTAAAALTAAFAWRSARHPAPVIEPHLLRQPVFAAATAANVVFGAAFGAMLLLVTLWCQDVWHWSALRTGLAVAPGPLLVPVLAIAAGPVARRVGPGPVAALGCAVYAAGCVFWRLNLGLTPDYAARMLPGMLLTGIGVGLTLPSLVGAAVSAVPPQRFATGSGIVTMARQVGIVIGIAVLVTVLGRYSAAGALPAFQRGTVILAATAAVAGLVALLLIPARARNMTTKEITARSDGS